MTSPINRPLSRNSDGVIVGEDTSRASMLRMTVRDLFEYLPQCKLSVPIRRYETYEVAYLIKYFQELQQKHIILICLLGLLFAVTLLIQDVLGREAESFLR